MKIQLIVVLALSLCVTSRDNDDDEGRPYEFGFTIDGQQHRHESKDVNGIIMGEFGFITGDGIYHVTVYATDENGSFKILSMRNVRVSGPLDEPGYEFPKKTPTLSQAIPNPPPPPPPTTTLAPITNFNAPYIFTTLPSLKVPACSGCKLPSTTPRPPGASNKLPFQTPLFQDKPVLANNPPVPPNIPPINPLAEILPSTFNNPPQNIPFGNQSPFAVEPVVPQISPEIHSPVFNAPKKSAPENLENFGVGIVGPRIEDKPKLVQPSIEQQPPFQNPGNHQSNDIYPTHENLQNPPVFQNSPQNSLKIPDQSSKPSNINYPNDVDVFRPPISVSNQQINIPGKDPILIKDPYPNMQDGLPAGITENDMLDLLYKFNYTLGFHGHHERGLKNGAKIGAYFVNGRDGIMRVVEYIADENGYRPKVKFINLGYDSPDTPKEGTEKSFGLKGFEFVWYPV